MAWLAGWGKRIEIEVDTTKIDSALTWFPILLHLSSSCGIGNDDVTTIFSEVGASSKKIAVTDSSGDTELYVEVEEWNYVASPVTNSEAWLWISKTGWVIPASDTGAQIIYIYYDSGHGDNANVGLCADGSAATEAVWNAEYLMVYHMKDATTSTVKDSTSNDIDGTKAAANQPLEVVGQIGQGQQGSHVNRQTYNIDVSASITVLDDPNSGTLEAWCDHTLGNIDAFFGVSDSAAKDRLLGWHINSKQTYYCRDLQVAGFDVILTANANASEGWHHFALAVTGGATTKMYEDGAEVAATMSRDADSGKFFNDPGSLDLAYVLAWTGLSNPPSAISLGCVDPVDEFRISTVDRGADWLKATYYSGADNLVTFGSEETTGFPHSQAVII